jgi:hypothetical protein
MSSSSPTLQELAAAKAGLLNQFKNVPGVNGFGVGEHSIRIYVRDSSLRQLIPPSFNNIEVECLVEADISARQASQT